MILILVWNVGVKIYVKVVGCVLKRANEMKKEIICKMVDFSISFKTEILVLTMLYAKCFTYYYSYKQTTTFVHLFCHQNFISKLSFFVCTYTVQLEANYIFT